MGAKYLGRSFTVITDHKAVISLLNGNNKKSKTLFSRLTRWLDRLIPFDFVKEHKPGAKIGIADYLSRHPSEPPKPISQYDNLFTVATIASIRKTLDFTNDLKSLGKRNHQDTKGTGSKQSTQFSSNQNRERKTCLQTATVEGGKSCVKTPTNRKRSICITLKSKKSKGNSVCSIYRSLGRRLNRPKSNNSNKMDNDSTCSFPVIEIDSQTNSPNRLNSQINSALRLDENLLRSDEITVINPEIVSITKNTRDSEINTVLSIPSKFPGEIFATVNPKQQIMSIIPGDCKVIKKSQALPELFNLEFVASNIPADVNLLRVKEALEKKINLKEELLKIGKYWAQYANDLSLRDGCVWLDGRLVIPLPLQVPIESRIHYYHHGKRTMYEAARDVWYPHMYRSLAAKATYCQQCTDAGKNLKNVITQGRRGEGP